MRCGNCGEVVEGHLHLNPAAQLPPVDCPLVIGVGDTLLRVSRTGYIQDRSRLMEYVTEDGNPILGRFDWTYP